MKPRLLELWRQQKRNVRDEMSRISKHVVEKCSTPDCQREGSFAKGLCHPCWRAFRSECILKGLWGKGSNPTPPKASGMIASWEYLGDESVLAELAARTEREMQERARLEKKR
jgi:hypothetical protein